MIRETLDSRYTPTVLKKTREVETFVLVLSWGIGGDDDVLSRLKQFFRPTVSSCSRRIDEIAVPCLDIALLIGDVHEQARVRIDELILLDESLDGDLDIGVKMPVSRMVPVGRGGEPGCWQQTAKEAFHLSVALKLIIESESDLPRKSQIEHVVLLIL